MNAVAAVVVEIVEVALIVTLVFVLVALVVRVFASDVVEAGVVIDTTLVKSPNVEMFRDIASKIGLVANVENSVSSFEMF